MRVTLKESGEGQVGVKAQLPVPKRNILNRLQGVLQVDI